MIDHSFEMLPDHQDLDIRAAQDIRINVELAGFSPGTADAFIAARVDPRTVAGLLADALQREQ
jgi:hypothetical protein